jgi:clan AA aspartic protease (TIGR02281 family)
VATVRFDPGEKNISVYASLNKKFVQKFIIDTGAEMTVIPLIAAEALGIRIDESTPPVMVTGVGVDVGYEATLDSVELIGQSVSNVKVLVLDISPEFGLLGINFLNNFHIEIDNQKGILRLRKKRGGGGPE